MSAESPSRFIQNLALHDAALQLQPEHQEDFQRLVKVLTQIHGFRLYFAQVDDIAYRDQLIKQLNTVLAQDGKIVQTLDLSTFTRTLPIDEFESVINAQPVGTVMHLLNSEVWLAQHAAQLNIRRNAIATHSQCALLWWLPHSAVARIATEAPDVWSWRHGVFGFAMHQAVAVDAGMLDAVARSGRIDPYATTLAQKSKRLAILRQLLAQEIADDLRFPLLIEMADLLEMTGHVEEALQCLREQALPLVELWAGHQAEGRAVTMGRIADVLAVRGEFDDAQRIYREQVLPVFDKRGDLRSRTLVMGKIADVLQMQGDLDEALKIRRDEELPVYDRLVDVRSRAVTMSKIADVLQAQGDLDEATRIRREEVLPVYDMVGDFRERAAVMLKIGDVLKARGRPDEALRIWRDDALPAFDSVGDVRLRAATMARIATVLQAQGRLDEALRIFLEEVLPVSEKLGDADSSRECQNWIDIILALRTNQASGTEIESLQ